MTMRLFVALRPPAAIRNALADTMDGVAEARWQDDDQLHCTLRFLGDVDSPVAEDVAACLDQVYAPAPVVALASVGSFAQRGRANALWAGLAPHDALTHLHHKVDQACIRAGLSSEGRAYLPHITLARLPRSAGGDPAIARWLAAHAGLTSEAFALSHIILYRSMLGSGGAVYEALARWPLGTR